MSALAPRTLGRTGLSVTPMCVGGGPLGSMPENFGYEVSAERGIETVRRALAGPINFLDTAAGYSDGGERAPRRRRPRRGRRPATCGCTDPTRRKALLS
jgi:aryl-alcohol dehydrogenase-like predicted oxidoreductase